MAAKIKKGDRVVLLTGKDKGRGGQVTNMTRDGIAPKRRGTWDYWSVDAQLEIIGEELRKAHDPEKGFQAPPGSQVVQRAEFDERLGYPRDYHRIVLGASLEIRWQITHFEALPVKAKAAAEKPGP